MMDIQALRRRMVEIAYKSGEGHLPSSLSCLEIIADLYDRVLTPDCRFVLSKGHAALALFTVLEAKGILPGGMLDTFCQEGSPLKGHPTLGVPGVYASTGSLGTGITYAAGIAYALRLKGSSGRVYCLIGDGEASEGAVYEVSLIDLRLHLTNLVVIVDSNESWFSTDRMVELADIFGWHIRKTTKGHGIKRMEADPARYHHSKLSAQEYEEIMSELGA